MTKKSAGLLIFRAKEGGLEVFLVHPGGPFWAKKDTHSWSIPKGEPGENEEMLYAAIRETEEETGIKVAGDFIELEPVKQKSGKWVYAWAIKNNIDITEVKSNFFEMEWPPRSGKIKSFPEVDKAEWFEIAEAKNKIIEGQVPLLEQLETLLKLNNIK
ncbi:MAG: NUDIX domain-containing protein [Chitinophagaceae bacterium]|nr:NUDIX domain-containing protein [Chitinophagaceae bacterium]